MSRVSIWALFWLALASTANAHPLAPSLLDLRVLESGLVQVRFKQPALRPRGSAVQPVLPAHCTAAGPSETQREGTGVVSSWSVDCGERGLLGQRIGFSGFATSGTNALVRVELADGSRQQGVVHAGEPTLLILAEPSLWEAARDYAVLGFGHILGGVDHLLFIAGLLLLVSGTRQLVATVTAFTLGHSVTLSLAALGVVDAPTGPIEVAIAASILYLATEIADRSGTPIGVWRKPYVLAASFGLLHGFGFAGALAEVGLPSSDIPIALASFNLGIEIGQLAFVSGLIAAFQALRRIHFAPPAWGRTAAAYGIGSLAAMWMFERASALL